MSNFLNKNKFKNKFFRVAAKVLVFSLFSFFFLNLSFDFFDGTIGFNEGFCQNNIATGQAYGDDPADIGAAEAVSGNSNDEVSAGSNLNPANWIPNLLLAVLQLASYMVRIAVFLFEVAINPALFERIFVEQGDMLFEIWGFIRDVLNIFFILILLFSAFATVFQVSKYHIKNIILMVVLMALLVNFSWPITRVIIDLSNVTMYFFAEEMLGDPDGTSTTAKLGALSNLSKILAPEGFEGIVEQQGEWSYLLLAIIVVFVFGITLLAYSGVLAIRVVALAMLLVFSPVGFVAAAFPSTSRYASEWWNKLFKYAFSGPILVFMLVVAIKMMEAIGGSDLADKGDQLSGIFSQEGLENVFNSLAKDAAFFILPIIVLWTALIVSGKAGDGASAWVSNRAQGWAKNGHKLTYKYGKTGGHYAGRTTDFFTGTATGWAGKKLSDKYGESSRLGRLGKGMENKSFKAYAATRGYAKGVKEQAKYKIITEPQKAYEAKRDEFEAKGKTKPLGWESVGDKTAIQTLENKKAAAKRKFLKENDVDFDSMVDQAKKADGADLRGIVESISSNDNLGSLKHTDYSAIMKKIKKSSMISKEGSQGLLTAKLKSKNKLDVILAGSDNKDEVFEKHISTMKGKDLAKHIGLFVRDKKSKKSVLEDKDKSGDVYDKVKDLMKSPEFKSNFLANASGSVIEDSKKTGILSGANSISELKQKTIITPGEASILRNQEQLRNVRK